MTTIIGKAVICGAAAVLLGAVTAGEARAEGCMFPPGAGNSAWRDPCPMQPGGGSQSGPAATAPLGQPEVKIAGNSLPDGNEYFSLSWRCDSLAGQRRLAAEITRRTLAGRLTNRFKGEFLIEAALYQYTLLTGFGVGSVAMGTPAYRAPMLHYIYDDTNTASGSGPIVTVLDGGCQTDVIRNVRKSNTMRVVVRLLYTEQFSAEPAFGNFLRALSAVAGLTWGGPIGGVVASNLMSAGQQSSQQSFAAFLNKFQDSYDISSPFDFPPDKTQATVSYAPGVSVSLVKVGRDSLLYDGTRNPLPSSGYVGEFKARAFVDIRSFEPSAADVANMAPEDARTKRCLTVAQKISDLNLSDRDRLMLTYAFAALPPTGPGKPCFEAIEVDYLATMGWKREPYAGAFPKPDAPQQVAGNNK